MLKIDFNATKLQPLKPIPKAPDNNIKNNENKNNQLINETKNEMNYQILKNLNEEKKILILKKMKINITQKILNQKNLNRKIIIY